MSGHSRLIKLGMVAAAHGIRGQVKIRAFTSDPKNITAYGPLQDASGKLFKIRITGSTNDALIASIDGINDRNAADAIRNTELFIPREALPATNKNEYYHEDLAGLKLATADGTPYGTITALHNFGAGDLASITRTSGEEEFQPFTKAIFPQIAIEKGTAVIVPPEIDGDE